MKLDVVGNNGPHPHPQGGNVVDVEQLPVALADSTENPFGNRVVHVQLAARKQVESSLVEQEAQRAKIHQTRRVMREVDKLHIATVVNTEFQSLRNIVHLGGNDGIRLVKIKLGQHLKQGHAFIELLGCLGVDAINLNHNPVSWFCTRLRASMANL